MKRCVNLDWLELHAYEPLMGTLNADYFERHGYHVERREYGTRVYREMFTILDNHGYGMIEIRRNPASQGLHGIHAPNECHIRLTNRTCYWDNAADMLNEFVRKHQYYNVRISRVDICLDFATFDTGDDPADFIRRYFKHRYAKINQGRITSHGEDTWSGQEWNSLSWGSKTSPVSTKMYDKTMELFQAKFGTYKKPYIRQAWLECNLIDDIDRCTLKGEQQRIWRVEFSLTSVKRGWVPIELDGVQYNYQSIRNTLEVYSSRENMLVIFASLCQHYFRFKYYEEGKRKDRCKDKKIFVWNDVEQFYKIGKPSEVLGTGNKEFEKWNRLLLMLEQFRPNLRTNDVTTAYDVIVTAVKDEVMRSNLINPYDTKELMIIKKMIETRFNFPQFSYDVALDYVKKLLNINNKTLSTH